MEHMAQAIQKQYKLHVRIIHGSTHPSDRRPTEGTCSTRCAASDRGSVVGKGKLKVFVEMRMPYTVQQFVISRENATR